MLYKLKIILSRTTLYLIYFLIAAGAIIPKKKKQPKNDIVLTGTFYSKNWIKAHILPLSQSGYIQNVYVVANEFDCEIPNVTIITPHKKLCLLTGNTIARLLTFIYSAIKLRPDFLGGFHLLFNGTIAILIAKFIRARSIYFSVGGVTETLVTGKTENSFFRFLQQHDPVITRTLCKIAGQADKIVTMGSGAKIFFVKNGISGEKIHIISGTIDEKRFFPSRNQNKEFDAILTARLTEVKQVELYIDIAENLQRKNKNIKFAIVGGGPLKKHLEDYAEKKGLTNTVYFAGEQENICEWLNKSKVFALTSRSEGLSLAMLEAMACGKPVVVPNVGDLSDVVIDGVNGYLIENHNADEFSEKISRLATNSDLNRLFSKKAEDSAATFQLPKVIKKWDELLY